VKCDRLPALPILRRGRTSGTALSIVDAARFCCPCIDDISTWVDDLYADHLVGTALRRQARMATLLHGIAGNEQRHRTAD